MRFWHALAILGGGAVGAAGLAALCAGIAEAASVKRIGHIKTLAGRDLRETIAYEIDEQPGLVRLWCEEFGLWGSGASFLGALTELTTALVALWSDYVSTPNGSLGPDAVKQKNRLRYLMGDAQ